MAGIFASQQEAVPSQWLRRALVVALGLAAIAVQAASEPCPHHGALDSAYCDRNRDLVADTPYDASKWVDPDPLVFSYTPVEDPNVYAGVWRGFLTHLAEVTGRRTVFFPVQTNARQLKALREGRIHVAGVNTGSNPVAVNCAGFVPFSMMKDADGGFGYEMEIIVNAESGLKTPADIAGRTLVFTSPNSNSGYKAPATVLRTEFSLVVNRDYQASFSGKHDNSIRGVAAGDYEVAAIANSVLERMVRRKVVDPASIRTIYRSRTFPTTAYGHTHNLRPALAERVREAFRTFDWEGSALAKEFEGRVGFMPISYQREWAIIRDIDAASGVRYACQ